MNKTQRFMFHLDQLLKDCQTFLTPANLTYRSCIVYLLYLCRRNHGGEASIWLGFKMCVCPSYKRYVRIVGVSSSIKGAQKDSTYHRYPLMSLAHGKACPMGFRDYLCARLPSSEWSCSSWDYPSYLLSGHISYSAQRTDTSLG